MSEYIEHDAQGISVGLVEKKTYTFAEPPHEMQLESGAKLGPITLAYETYGELTPLKNNAVLMLHALPATPMRPVTTRKQIENPDGGISWSAPARASTPTSIL